MFATIYLTLESVTRTSINTKPDIKALLQDIYMSLGMIETAKATDITTYMPQVKECMHTIDGKRISGYQIP